MTQDHRPTGESNLNLSVESSQINRGTSIKFSHYVFVFGLSLTLLVSVIAVAWYGFGRSYWMSVENRLSATAAATKDVVQASEIKELKNSLSDLQRQVQELKANSVAAANYHSDYIELQKRIDAVQLNTDQKKLGATENGTADKWKYALISAIKTGSPLEEFRRNAKVPEGVRGEIEGIDFIPTYKNISEEWGKIKDRITLQANDEKLSPTKANGWWGNFKIFLKKIFRIQRLDENNLTQEEIFVRHTDKLLVEKEIKELTQWIEMYQHRFDVSTKHITAAWFRKLEKFLQGQLILEMVKKY